LGETIRLRVVVLMGVWSPLPAISSSRARRAAELREAELERVESKRMLEARLQVMQAQVEPHFLFNTWLTCNGSIKPIRYVAARCWTASALPVRGASPNAATVDAGPGRAGTGLPDTQRTEWVEGSSSRWQYRTRFRPPPCRR
jgi:hypothetical protein